MTHDLDHTHYYSVLTEDYDFERKAWYAFAFGQTYRTPQAFAYTEHFPYIQQFTKDEIQKWHETNWKRTSYGTDARYNKGHFAEQTASVLEWLGKRSFQEKLDSILVFDTEKENFWALYKEILSLHKYGRMTGWITMQCLYDLLHLPIDPEDILLEGFSPGGDSSLGSIWNGLCALTNRPEMMVGQYGNYTPTQKDIGWGKEMLMHYTNLAEENAGFRIDSFRCESIWCQYKRLFNENASKEYPGHASGDATSRYLYYKEHWKDVDWAKFRKALRQQPGLVKGLTYHKPFNAIFGETGILLNMNELYDDMPNSWNFLDENPNWYLVKDIWLDDGLEPPVIDPENSTFFEDLKTTPKYYKEIYV